MKKFICLIIITAVCFVVSCKKGEEKPAPAPAPPAPPTADSSANPQFPKERDISFTTFLIADIEAIVSYYAEKMVLTPYYAPVPTASTSTVTMIRDSLGKMMLVGFNQSKGMDGRLRDGTVMIQFGLDATAPHASYVHDYKYSAKLFLLDYKVNGYKISVFNGTSATYINKVSSPSYNPSQVNLTWEISGKFVFTHTTDPSRNIVWDGTLIKTLANTSDTSVFNASKTKPINWNKAIVHYSGNVTGTIGGVPFTYSIGNQSPLVRDFNCNAPTSDTSVTRLHPFISGIATCNINGVNTVDFGPQGACDIFGNVNQTYGISFR